MKLPVVPSRSLTAYNQNAKLDVVIEMSLADPLPVPHFSFIFNVPAAVATIALQNKAVVNDVLLKTLPLIDVNPMHIGAETGMIAIFHTPGQPLTHHPHAHCLVAWQRAGLPLMEAGLASAPASSFSFGFSYDYRRLFVECLQEAPGDAKLQLFGHPALLSELAAFGRQLNASAKSNGSSRQAPFGGTRAGSCLSRAATPDRVAIANRLLTCEQGHPLATQELIAPATNPK